MNSPIGKKDRYYKELQDDIKDYLVPISLQFKRFPWSTVNKVHFTKDMKFTISGVKFNGIELKNNLNKLETSLKKKVKVNYFNPYLRRFEKDAKTMDEKDIPSLFNEYREEIVSEIKSVEMDLNFCLNALKEINKININESEDIEMDTEMLVTLLSYYEDAYEDDLELLEDETFEEGATNDVRIEFSRAKKEYKKNLKAYKKNLKNKKFDDALKNLKEVKKTLKESQNIIKSTDSSVFSTICGFLLNYLILFGKELVVCGLGFYLPTVILLGKARKSNSIKFIGTAAGVNAGLGVVTGIVGECISLYDGLTVVISTVQKCLDDGINANSLNIYKNKCEYAVSEYIKNIEKLEGITKDAKKEYNKEKKEKAVKESVTDSMKEAKIVLYESYANGDITLEEREELLQSLMESTMIDNYIKADEIDNDTELKTEKYESVKSLIQESFLNGEITLEECEALKIKARDRILYEETSEEGPELDGDPIEESVGPEFDPEGE